jgi:putative lipoic acid-binding regulatory protein
MSTTAQSPEQFWAKFKTDLQANYAFPTEYVYKFIVPTDAVKLKTLKNIFSDTDAEFSYRESSSKKYTSVTIVLLHKTVDDVIAYYQQAVLIEGIKSL